MHSQVNTATCLQMARCL